jgi:hypothetical protein
MLDGTPMIFPMMDKLKKLIIAQLPTVMEYLEECDLDMMMCFGEQLFTILLYDVPRTFAKRILDLFLFEGEEMIFSIIINMLKICKDKILSLEAEVLLFYLYYRNLKIFLRRGC